MPPYENPTASSVDTERATLTERVAAVIHDVYCEGCTHSGEHACEAAAVAVVEMLSSEAP